MSRIEAFVIAKGRRRESGRKRKRGAQKGKGKKKKKEMKGNREGGSRGDTLHPNNGAVVEPHPKTWSPKS